MDRDKIFRILSIALAAVALVLGIFSALNVSNVKDSISFDTSVDVAIAGPTGEEAAEAGTEAETAAEGETSAETSTEGTEEGTSTEGQMSGTVNIILRDGVLKLMDSYIKVPSAEGSEAGNICVYLAGENTVRYNSGTDYLVVNDRTIIKAINAVDITYNGISEFMGSDGSPILIGERLISPTAGIAVVYNLEGTSPATEDDVAVVESILDNAAADVTINGLTLFGVSANPDWTETIIMTDKAVQLMKGTSSIYVSPYTGSFADGTTNTLNASTVTMTYSDNIKDTSTGYSPYIYEFSADQNGTVSSSSSSTSTLRAKFLAQSNMNLMDLFG